MATITFGAGVAGSVPLVINLIDQLSFDAELTSFSSTQITFQDGTRNFVVNGTGFTVNPVNGQLTGGTIAEIVATNAGNNEVLITNIGLLATQLQTALNAENSGTNIAALENLLTGLSYDYTGTAAADILLSTTRSSDNVLLNLRGNDRFNLLGGNDNVFMGDGNDSGLGGIGNDTLDGGNGNDTLQGQAGNDVLRGSIGNDFIAGSTGNDFLYGGAGNDRLVGGDNIDSIYGGDGKDTLTGDDGADRFIFASATETGNGSTRDQISDFDATEGDRIDLTGMDLVAFRGNLGFSSVGPSARWIQSGNNVLLLIDTDGDRDIDGSVLLLSHIGMNAGDVLI